jgi:signal transduction protein with GAF and PtsI domain
MASEPLSAMLLIGLGYDTLSVAPPALPLIKWLVRNVPAEVCRVAASKALAAATAPEINAILRDAVQGHVDKRLLDL